jgi:hypothetical protein
MLTFGERVSNGKKELQVEMGKKEVLVEVWESRGLSIHCYKDTIDGGGWRISHMQSGRSILRHMWTREQAIKYLMRIDSWRSKEGFLVNWRMTEQQFKNLSNKQEIMEMLNGLQREISGERR